jgi:hypothetical protein
LTCSRFLGDDKDCLETRIRSIPELRRNSGQPCHLDQAEFLEIGRDFENCLTLLIDHETPFHKADFSCGPEYR